MIYGVTPQGFVTKRLADIKAELESDMRSAFGSGIDLTEESPLGQIVGIYSEREAAIWELAESVYLSGYPDTAEGVSLDNVGSITGLERATKTFSKATVILYGDEGTVIPAGRIASVFGDPDARFVLIDRATIGAPVDEIQKIAFEATPTSGGWSLSYKGQVTTTLAFNAAAAAVQAALRALSNLSDDLTVTGNYAAGFNVTYSGADGSVNQDALIVVANTLLSSATPIWVTITTIAEGHPPQVVGLMQAELAGAVLAPAGSLTVIETPQSGWSGITNTIDAAIGNDLELDPAYRIRRNNLIQKAGAGTLEAIRVDLLNLEGVTDVIMFENTNTSTDDNGLPAHSFRAVVVGGEDQIIGNTIWEDKPAGIQSDGNTSIDIVDSMNYPHVVQFSRPYEIPVWMRITIYTDALIFPDNGEAQIKQALVDKGKTLGIGDDVIASPFLISNLASIPGITYAQVELAESLSDIEDDFTVTIIPIERFEVATFDTSRIEVIFP